jgi:hypothetical protein
MLELLQWDPKLPIPFLNFDAMWRVLRPLLRLLLWLLPAHVADPLTCQDSTAGGQPARSSGVGTSCMSPANVKGVLTVSGNVWAEITYMLGRQKLQMQYNTLTMGRHSCIRARTDASMTAPG